MLFEQIDSYLTTIYIDATGLSRIGNDIRLKQRDTGMNNNDDPNIVTSGKSERIIVDDLQLMIQIFRIEGDKNWTLEVVDKENTSHIWDDEFASDTEARDTAIAAIKSEGAVVFMRGDNVVPFRR